MPVPLPVNNLILVIVCTGLSMVCYSQSFRSPQTAIYSGLGALSKSFQDVFSFAENPAGLNELQGISAGLYAERRFMLAELNQYVAAAHYGLVNSGIGIQMHYAGSSAYNESMAGLSYGRNLGKISLGLQFNYHKISISGYGSDGTYSADIAVIWQLTDKLRAGIQVINPVPVFFGPGKSEQYSSMYKLGMGFEFSGKCFLAGEINKETEKTVNVILAIQYGFSGKMYLKAGVNTDIGKPFAGVGWTLADFRLDVTGSYHPGLGFTPGMMVIFKNRKRK